jgi:glycosyltransferase involved in cell wall biosynthesis
MAASGLQALGHNVVVVCRNNSILSKRSLSKGLSVKEITVNSDFDFVACAKFCFFFKSYKPAVVIGCQNKDWRVASMSLKILGSQARVYSRQGLQLLKNSWWYKCTIKLFSHGIITNTHTIKEFYDSFLPVNDDFVKVIFNGVEMINETVDSFDYSEYIPSGVTDPVIVLSTGRLARQKGFEYLIDAAERIIRNNPNVYFFLAGHGKLQGELQARIELRGIQKNFFLLGFIENIYALLKGAHIFVFSSLYEGMPNSVLEAMAWGLPVVSTNVNGVKELIKHGEDGFTVEPKDIDGLTKALVKLIHSTELRSEIGNNAKKMVAEKFSVNAMIENLDDFIAIQ